MSIDLVSIECSIVEQPAGSMPALRRLGDTKVADEGQVVGCDEREASAHECESFQLQVVVVVEVVEVQNR